VIDSSNGYEEHAETFVRARNQRIGPDVMRDWVRKLEPGSTVLELGCGHGVISEVLTEAKVSLYAIDASPTLLRAFRERFPAAAAECADANTSAFFDRTFDGIVAWGLLFLLAEDAQRHLLMKAANALKPGGQFVFTAPRGAVTWNDSITGLESRSLGQAEYERILAEAGLVVEQGREDSGENYYYCGRRPAG
jgi:SAM-dependent methyltransferase